MDESLNPDHSSDRECTRGLDIDRISKLQDSLLQHILSFVSTTDAVRTSLLSRRWQNLWKLVSCLDLSTELFSDKNDFCNFIDKFLDLRGDSPLQKFEVSYELSKRPILRLKSWIDAAVTCKVEHLKVGYWCGHDESDVSIETSQSLFTCNTLVILRLHEVFFLDVPTKVSLSNLKIMHLENVTYANDFAFKSLISGCPVIEELSICRPSKDNVKVLCVCSPTLKVLSIVFYEFYDDEVQELVIDAPNLENLSLADEVSESFMITNIGSSSLKVDLDVRYSRNFRDELFTGISNARSLTIGLYTFELLCRYRRFEAVPQFHNLIHLRAELSQSACKVLPAILECCPNLISLELELHDDDTEGIHPVTLSPAEPRRMYLSLKSIILKSLVFGEATEMKLIKYFLQESPVLKEMKMYLGKLPNLEEEFRILKDILTFPRRSTACRVYFKQARFNFS